MLSFNLKNITPLLFAFTLLACKESQFHYEEVKIDDKVFARAKMTKNSDQIVGIEVDDTASFYLYFKDYYNPMYYGVGIYTYYCLRCHAAYPITKEIFRDEYLQMDSLYDFIKSKSHVENSSENGMDELNKEEVYLMLKYIKGESD